MQGGTGTLRELGMILNGFSTADTTLSAPPDHPLYEKVTYLMSLKEAVAALGLDQATAQSQSKVVCPGFPRDSFRYVSYDGIFEGVYNRIDLVDGADQVVALQLVDERPKSTSRTRFMLEGDWMTYDFIGYRLKAIDQMKVKYDPCIRSGSAPRWHRIDRTPLSHDWTKASVLRVDCVLENKDGKAMEQTRWYVPKPLGNLILFCIQKNGR